MFSKGKDSSEQDVTLLRTTKAAEPGPRPAAAATAAAPPAAEAASSISAGMTVVGKLVGDGAITIHEIGRASCRERV